MSRKSAEEILEQADAARVETAAREEAGYEAAVTAVAKGVKILCEAGMGASEAGALAAKIYTEGRY